MTEVFVGNISFSANEDDVRNVFESAGLNVDRVRLISDRDTGKSKGFGFVKLNGDINIESVQEMITGTPIHGRKINVEPAKGVQKRSGRN